MREKVKSRRKKQRFSVLKQTNNDSEGVGFHSHYDKWEHTQRPRLQNTHTHTPLESGFWVVEPVPVLTGAELLGGTQLRFLPENLPLSLMVGVLVSVSPKAQVQQPPAG